MSKIITEKMIKDYQELGVVYIPSLFREHVSNTQPDVNLSYILDNGEEVSVPIGLNFFWPDYK